MYHQIHHGGRLIFHGFRDYELVFVRFELFLNFNANDKIRTPTIKSGGKRGVAGTRDADLRKAVFQVI